MDTLTKFKISTVIYPVLAILLWTGFAAGAAYAKGISPSSNRLLTKLQTQDTIRVIVTARDEAYNRQINSRYSIVDPEPGLVERYKNPKKLKLVREFKHLPHKVYEVDAEGLQELLNDPNVSVHENRIARPSLAQSVARVYPSQKFSQYHGNNDWAVVIIDSGVNSEHPMLAGKVVSEACYSTTDKSGDPDQYYHSLCLDEFDKEVQSSVAAGSGQDCSIGVMGSIGEGMPIDDCGHGTAMAGIAVGNGGGKLGVAKDGKVIAIKVVSQTSDFDLCDTSPCAVVREEDLTAAFDRVLELKLSGNYKIAAVNLSLNFDLIAQGNANCDGDPFKDNIDMLLAAGIPTVVSVGNGGLENSLQSPGCISTAFAVGATSDNSDSLWSGTNRGELMDIFAPGANITTAQGVDDYATISGTSAAAAHVSGAWVAARHALPTASVAELEGRIRSKGPVVYVKDASSIRRLDLTSILDSIDPGSQDNPNPPTLNSLILAPIYLLLFDEEPVL
jgi:subtilisin family serine protease